MRPDGPQIAGRFHFRAWREAVRTAVPVAQPYPAEQVSSSVSASGVFQDSIASSPLLHQT